jgi:hypothetical protein
MTTLLSRLSRRRALKLGAGAAFAAAFGHFAESAFAAGGTAAAGSPIGAVTTIDGESVVVQVRETGQVLTACLGQFPAGVSPRVGDLVAVSAGRPMVAATARCRAAASAAGVPLIAVPVVTWTVGVPASRNGELIIGTRRLAGSDSVAAAASAGKAVSVGTLDSTLSDHIVLAIRPA